MFQELEETTAKINLKCKQILLIMNNPFLFMMKTNELDGLMNGISYDLTVLNNFMSTFNEMYNEKGENNEE